MEKINIVKLLKDCPEGTKLYSLVHGEVELTRVGVECIYCIPNYLKRYEIEFNLDGRWIENMGECILFPSKENRDWAKFQRPFKDGDVLYIDCNDDGDTDEHYQYIFILKNISEGKIDSYCYVTGTNESKFNICYLADLPYHPRFATEEEKEKLFKAIQDNGYKWNAETKTLEKVIVPKFKVGDRIKEKRSYMCGEIIDVQNNRYNVKIDDKGLYVYFREQDDWELVPNKFDITTLKPFESKVLVKEDKTDVWRPTFYGFFNQKNKRFYTATNTTWRMCIPYNEDTKHLTGTTNDCDEYFKTWE